MATGDEAAAVAGLPAHSAVNVPAIDPVTTALATDYASKIAPLTVTPAGGAVSTAATASSASNAGTVETVPGRYTGAASVEPMIAEDDTQEDADEHHDEHHHDHDDHHHDDHHHHPGPLPRGTHML